MISDNRLNGITTDARVMKKMAMLRARYSYAVSTAVLEMTIQSRKSLRLMNLRDTVYSNRCLYAIIACIVRVSCDCNLHFPLIVLFQIFIRRPLITISGNSGFFVGIFSFYAFSACKNDESFCMNIFGCC